MRYTEEANRLILSAAQQARRLGHSYVGSQHLLVAMVNEPGWTGHLLQISGLDEDHALAILARLYGVGAQMPLPHGFSNTAKHLLRSAALEAKRMGHKDIRSVHILLAMLRREKTGARAVLRSAQIDPNEVFTRTID